jgi:hypothetical protein
MGFTYKDAKTAGEVVALAQPGPDAIRDYDQRLRAVMQANSRLATRGEAAPFMAANYPALYAAYTGASGKTR